MNPDEDTVHLMLPFNAADHHVELTPYHDFISPEMVIETRGDGPINDLNARLRFKRVSDEQCHYRGFVRDHTNSRAVLSLCDGVAGYVQTDHGGYFIEPMSESTPGKDGQHVHMIYKRRVQHEENSPKHQCGTDDWESAWAEQLAKRQQRLIETGNSGSLKRSDDKKSSSGTHSIHRYIEVGLVADRQFLDYHNGTDYEKYLLTIMNMVSDFYHDASVGNQIDAVLVRIIYLEDEKKELDLSITPKAEGTLKSFAAWANKMNPKDVTHPNHYDIAVLITRYDICAEDTGCTLTGLAYVSAVCDPPKAAAICQDSGLLLGIVVAHEVGHLLGCAHDEESISGCPPKDKDESYFIMSPIVSIYTLRWSTCSRKYITNLLEGGLGECLNNDPRSPSERFKYPNILPGVMYDATAQCTFMEAGSELCLTSVDLVCDKLWCQKGTRCFSNHAPAAEGTKCATDMWCIRRNCVDMGARPSAVHGGWGEWGPTNQCSRTCGGGIKFSERECNKPSPSNGGRYCIGERKKISTCNVTPCDPLKPTFRATQCAEYNSQPVLPDGLHQWKPFMQGNVDFCVLYCINENNEFAKLSPAVKDATPCKGGTNNMCIGGVCRKVGCDWVLDSDTVEDKCGVCRGDGTHCTPVEGVYTETGRGDYQKIVTIPKGARSIRIVEKDDCPNLLAVKKENGAEYCLNGNHEQVPTGEYPCAGSILVYSQASATREEINIKGPLTEDIQVQYAFLSPSENPGVKYTYYIMTDNEGYQPKYLWDFTEWTPCDVKCGGGTMISKPSCIEQQNGIVSPSFCEGITKPEPKTRICNEHPCPAVWRVSQWSRCNACDGKKGTKHRKVQCFKRAARPGADDVQSDFKSCKGRVPKQKQDCIGTRPCKLICPKKSRSSASFVHNEEDDNEGLIDTELAKYFERRERDDTSDSNKPIDDENVEDDLENLLEELVHDEKDKRACDKTPDQLKIIDGNIEGTKFTTPKVGSIIKDHNPLSSVILYEVPVKADSGKSYLSDTAFREIGDSVPVELDTKHQKVYKGEEALKRLHKMANQNTTRNSEYLRDRGVDNSDNTYTESFE